MITVKLFAILKEHAGRDEITFELASGTVWDLLEQVTQACPGLSDFVKPGRIMISVNHEFVKKDAPVKDGDEVALMPPFSGRSGKSGKVRIQQGPFSLEQEIELLKQSSSSIGGIVTFLGTTRDISQNKQVAKLEFEHYPGMAEKKLSEIRIRAIQEYGVIDITIIHRVGTIPAGENIVLVGVASQHRDEAFKACRFCIDELKRIMPIWKKESTPDEEAWAEEHP